MGDRVPFAAVCLAIAAIGVVAAAPCLAVQQTPDPPASKRLLDGRQWTTTNLNVAIEDSYCYDGREEHCLHYGRLYTWAAAQRACQALGGGWRLPTNDDWARMARPYGGVRDESADGGKAAFAALVPGGSSGFDASFGGGRDVQGQYARLDAHGFYWTATESGAGTAWLYNLGRNGGILNRHRDGETPRAYAVRCLRDDPDASTPGDR
jgi:uncharacterized protein (TIGR02145 family)